MINLRSIMSLLAMGSVVIDNPMPKKIVSHALSAIVMVVLTCLSLITLIVAGLFLFYFYMTSIGYTAMMTIGMIAGFLAALTLVSVIFAVRAVKKLMGDADSDFKRSVPLPSHIANQAGNAIEAFVDGLMNRPPQDTVANKKKSR